MPRVPYKLKSGKRVVGVTTVIGTLMDYGKQDSLMDWGQKLAVNYEDGIHKPIPWRLERNHRGSVGTLSHSLIMEAITGVCDEKDNYLDVYTTGEIEEAETIMGVYMNWYEKQPSDIKSVETPMVSERFKYGGCPDIITNMPNSIDDIKTGYVSDRNFYELCMQLSAYDQLNKENNNHVIEMGRILKVDTGGVRVIEFNRKQLDQTFLDFISLLSTYKSKQVFDRDIKMLNKKVKGGM